MCLSDIFLSFVPFSYRTCRLCAIAQVPVSCTDTVSYLFPEQAEAQLSATTQGTPTVTSPLFTKHIEMFDKDIFTARVHAGLSVCAIVVSVNHRVCYSVSV